MRQLKIIKQITNRDTASLDKYLQEIGKEELVSADEEAILARKIKQGDCKALEKLTKANLRFVISVSKQYQNQGLSLSDLINEGNLGLIKAAKRFDETRGFKFISYAVWWIRQSILQAIAEQARIVRLPLNKLGAINKINKTYSELEQKFEREPSSTEIAEALNLTESEVKDSMKTSSRHVSMDAPIANAEDEGRNLYDTLKGEEDCSPEFGLMCESLKKEVARAMTVLTPREAEILCCLFGLNGVTMMSLDEIGEHIGLTRERIRQIREKAIRRLKNTSRSKILKTYLG